MKYHYVWFFWASAFLVPWTLLHIAQPAMRRQMIEVSAATSLPGLTEPLFVPKYLFLILYATLMLLLVISAPGYIERVWNLADLSAVLVAGIPLEELAFGFASGLYWAGVYEHRTWKRGEIHDRSFAPQE